MSRTPTSPAHAGRAARPATGSCGGPLVEDFEPRILYAADHPAALLGALAAGAPGGSGDMASSALVATATLPTSAMTRTASASAFEIVFIDTQLPDVDTLLTDLAVQAQHGRRLEVVTIGPHEDGLATIGATLAEHPGASAVHLVFHGASGRLQLGDGVLDDATLLRRADEVAAWGTHLDAGADVLLYGCDLAAGPDGDALVRHLAQLTGADVAASTDLTGQAARGGDWTLERQTGAIETPVAFDLQTQAHWQGLLTTYTVSNTGDSGAGSLRQALLDANAHAGTDNIVFSIAGTGTHTITLSSVLPSITGTVVLDATTDDSFAANGNRPAIVIDVGNGNNSNGLRLTSTADGSTVRGLAIWNFGNAGILIDAGSDGNTIAGNYVGTVGTDGAYHAGSGAGSYGIRVDGANNTIGGAAAADRNVVGTEGNYDVFVTGASATGNLVTGNRIGVNAAGNASLPGSGTGVTLWLTGSGNTVSDNVIANDGYGLYAYVSNGNSFTGNRIGLRADGTATLVGSSIGIMLQSADGMTVGNNWIGAAGCGIQVLSGSDGNLIQGNRIGTDQAGTANWGSTLDGIAVAGNNNRIGGSASGEGNVVAFSNRGGSSNDGIAVSGGTGNAVLGNQVFGTLAGTGGLGIDLGASGVTANDPGDADTGANNLQNFPVLSYAKTDGSSQVLVGGTLSSTANGHFRLEFFASPTGNSLGYGEGQFYLGYANVDTDAAGAASFSATLSATIPAGYAITATATTTDASHTVYGDTSEFAANLQAGPPPVNTVPGAQSVAEDTTLNLAGLSVANNGGLTTSVALTVLHGALNVNLAGGATLMAGSQGSASLTIGGSVAQVNAALATLRYQGGANYAGPDQLAIVTTDLSGLSDSDQIALTVTPVNDAPSGAPVITGTATEDQTLAVSTAGIADADGLGSLAYQWLRNGAAVAGATGTTYTLGDADVGQAISVRVSYIDGQGTSESITSATVGPIANVNDTPTGLPVVTGTPTEDQTLTANTAGLGDADGLGSFAYQWLRNGATIAGATSTTYTLGDADVGQAVSVRVSYVDGQGTAESITSATVGPVANVNDAPTGLPIVTGTPTEDQTLTANTAGLGDADGLGSFAYQWLRNGATIAGATSTTYTLGDADVGQAVSVRVSYTDGHGTNETVTSASVGPVANVNDAPTGSPIVTGTPTEDQTLTANTAGLGDADGLGSFAYQWLRNGATIAGATSTTYTLGDTDVGQAISVRVSYVDGQGTAESITSATVGPVANVNDAPTGSPVVTGTPTRTETLTANTAGIGDADGLGTFSIQWLRNGADIAGATAGSYLLNDADVSQSIGVRVTYTDGHGTAESLTSAAVGPVSGFNTPAVGQPVITGSPIEDQVLVADTSGISDADGLGTFAYQWTRNGADIAGAGGTTYTPGDADVGQSLGVRVSYIDGQGTAESIPSATVGPVANVNDAPTGLPVITGSPTEDQTLGVDTASIGDADGLGSFAYQWLRNGAAVAGATGTTYTLGDADVGQAISVRVSYVDGHGTAESITSATVGPIANVNDTPTGLPVVTGTPTEDQILTANTAGVGDADGLGSFAYQWLRNGAAVAGATSTTYTLGDADVGQAISVRVSYTDGQGTAESISSATVGPVANVNDAPTGSPVVTGTPTEDQTLGVDTIGLGDADGLGALSYQWLRNGVVIGGAAGATYTLGDADVGTSIGLSVSYVDGQGTAETVMSAAVGPVANVNDVPTGSPVITGTPTEDQTLGVDTTGLGDADGLGALSYQWLRNGVAVAGATGATYALGDADVGQVVGVRMSYVDGQGTAESITSTTVGPIANVNDAPTGLPLVTGTPTEDQTLGVDTTSLGDADGLGSFAYQWLRNGSAIVGATGTTYTLGDADVGVSLGVVVSYTDGQGTAESVAAAAIGPIANVNDAPTGSPIVTGTPTENQTLTANTAGLGDADGLGNLSYQWLRNGVAIAGATGTTYTLGNADVGASLGVVVSYTDGHGTAESISSATVGPVANVNDAPTGSPVVTGTPTEDQTLGVDITSLGDADGLGSFAYQWLRNGAAVGGATGTTYTLGDADVSQAISVRVSYTDGHGTAESISSAAVGPVVNVDDAPTGLPVVTGTPTEDQTLGVDTTSLGDADGLGSFAYQWLRNGSAIAGATGTTYALGDADVGTSLSVVVSYTDGQGSTESVTSTPVGPIANVNDAPSGSPVVTGTPTEDQTLGVDTTGLSDADGLGALSYQWLRNGVAVVGATGTTYTLGDADVGTSLGVVVSYIDGQGAAESVTSTPVGPIANVNDAPTGSPIVTGTPAEDQTLGVSTARLGDADGLGTFSYQWLRDGLAVAGATGSTYTLGNADVGASIGVTVNYIDGQGMAESIGSVTVGPVVNVNDVPTGSPVVTGTPTEDQLLGVDATGLGDADGLGSFTYQWLRNGSVIAGATGATYTLGDADVGQAISARVSYVDGQGTAESITSAAVGPIANVNDAPTGSPVIIGTSTEDQTLGVDTTGLGDADGLSALSYQWLRNGVAIGGATSATYTLGDADVGANLSARVSYVDGQGTAESVISTAVGPIANLNDAPTGLPIVTGTPTEGRTLGIDTIGLGDADGLGSFTYQWLRNGVAVAGATGTTYTLGDADVGQAVSVRVDYTDGQGTAESITSAAVGPVVNVNDVPTGLPTITGIPTEDQPLGVNTTAIADLDGLGTFTYQWLRNGAAITGATASTYGLGDADVGQTISVRVSYIDGQGTAESITSTAVGPVANVNDAPVGLPVIIGTPAEDQTLGVDTTSIGDADGLGALSYQWLRNGVAIGGATGATYTLGDADVGQAISARVSYVDGHGSTESIISAATGQIANVNDAPTGSPVITGAPTEDQTLTADPAALGDADGLGAFSIQWLRDGTAIAGATGASYTLVGADVGARIGVTVSYLDGHGGAESVTTPSVGPVAPAAASGPRIVSNGGGARAAIDVASGNGAVTTVIAVDPDTRADELRYAITGGADAQRFAIDAQTGQLRFVALPQTWAPTDADGDGHYDVIVSATDGRHSATQRLTVSIEGDRTAAPPLAEPPRPPAPGTAEPSPVTPAADATHETGSAPARAAALVDRPASAGPHGPADDPSALRPADGRGLALRGPHAAAAPVPRLRLASGVELVPADWLTSTLMSPPLLAHAAWHYGTLTRWQADGDDAAPEAAQGSEVQVDGAVLAGLTVSFSVVAWAARSGLLMTSLLVSTPAWRSFDLLPVLGRRRDERDDASGDDDDDPASAGGIGRTGRRDQAVEDLA